MLNKISFPLLLASILFISPVFSQVRTNKAALETLVKREAAREKSDMRVLLSAAKLKGWPMIRHTKNGLATLVGMDPFGYPLYVSTGSTANAAASVGTDQLWAGGALGLSLSGSSNNMKGKLGVWDGGKINLTHVELRNRVLQKDIPANREDHATHVSGILVGQGINPLAKGMAFGAQQLIAYDYNFHIKEMGEEANVLLISNHSYTTIAGWSYNEEDKRWEFYGRYNENEDYKFGYYSDETRSWDEIAYNAPNYLIVKAAGNNRSQNGPEEGETYYRFNENETMSAAGIRPAGISSNNGYDVIATYGTAKNILTVGAIEPFSPGYTSPADAVLTNFTSWGPTDDGRIKPDVVADGVNLLSATSASDNSYASLSGTSMASPVVAGSLFLLQEYYTQLHAGVVMRSATLKGLLIHTALEAGGTPGPDYRFGWGVADIQQAAELIKSDNTDHLMHEQVLANGNTDIVNIIASGKGPLVATICWTDPAGTVDNSKPLNNRSPKLVNDLDIRVKSGGTTYFPWKLTPLAPAAAATRGDNTVDNVEKIEIADAVPGETYTIEINHKGSLSGGSQAYSLIVSGAGGAPYCSSSSLSTGARITGVQIGTFPFNNTSANCSVYKKFGSGNITVQSRQVLPVTVSLADCTGPVTNKIVKIFIDYNQNGGFEEEELVATSGIVTNSYNASVTIPENRVTGNSTILRIVAKEASGAGEVVACNNTGNGEVQDYKISFAPPFSDLSIPGLASPETSACPAAQLVTVKIRNIGGAPQSNIPVTTIIKNGNTVVSTLSAVYPGTIAGGKEVSYTYSTPFNAVAGTTYTFTTTANLDNDQNTQNNEQASSVVIRPLSNSPSGLSARICDGKVRLKAIDGSVGPVFWYETAGSTTPIASGYDTSSTVITPNKTYYAAVNAVSLKAGLPDKSITGAGSYAALTGNSVRFTTAVPLTIESGRLYVGSAGKVRITIGKVIDATHYLPQSSITLSVFATDPSPQPANSSTSGTYEPGDAGALYKLNLPVPEPGDYFLIFECMEGATIFYNSGIASNPYPLTIPGVISVTGNDPGGSNPDLYKRLYLGLYDIGISFFGCASARIPVQATLCDGEAPVEVVLGPNPNQGDFRVDIDLPAGTADLVLAVYNMLGQKVYTKTYPAFSGNFFQQVNAGPLAPGIYMLRIHHGEKTYSKKLIISR